MDKASKVNIIDNMELDKSNLESSDAIKFGEALEKLQKNEDFKLLFKQEFFKDYPLRIIRLKADPSVILSEMSHERLKSLDSIISASGVVQMFLLQIEAKYKNTKIELEKLSDAILQAKNIKKAKNVLASPKLSRKDGR